jgi:chromosome segregation ATPase
MTTADTHNAALDAERDFSPIAAENVRLTQQLADERDQLSLAHNDLRFAQEQLEEKQQQLEVEREKVKTLVQVLEQISDELVPADPEHATQWSPKIREMLGQIATVARAALAKAK